MTKRCTLLFAVFVGLAIAFLAGKTLHMNSTDGAPSQVIMDEFGHQMLHRSVEILREASRAAESGDHARAAWLMLDAAALERNADPSMLDSMSEPTLNERSAMMQFQLAGFGTEARALLKARYSSGSRVEESNRTRE